MSTDNFLPGEATFAALAEQPDDKPVVMLNLLEYTDDGESYAKYGRIALPQITKRGGKILCCPPCAKVRGYEQEDLIDGVEVIGSAALHALIKDGAHTLCF